MTNPVGAQVWSQTAANNATIDGSINWAEGMAPSQVNDSARAEMASMAKFISDNNGTLVTSGSSVAFTVATNQVESALTAGYTVAVQFHVTPDSSATLAVDGLAAKPLQVVSGLNLKGGEYLTGSITRFTYSTTGTGQWIANSAEVAVPGTTSGTNANAGLVGEYQSVLVTSGSGVSLTNNTNANVTSLSLTAGDWDIWADTFYQGSGTATALFVSLSTASSVTSSTALPIEGYDYGATFLNQAPISGLPLSGAELRVRASSGSSTTYFLNTLADFTGGALVGYGAIRARRIR